MVLTPAKTAKDLCGKAKRIRTAFSGSQVTDLGRKFRDTRYIDRIRRIKEKKEKAEGVDFSYSKPSSTRNNAGKFISASHTDNGTRCSLSLVVSLQYANGQYDVPPSVSAQFAVQAPPALPVQRPNDYGEDGLVTPPAPSLD
ncbi:hypothetical protein EVAR_23090_1 [Eumeta japonica]|uniref:Uncharacterized protein n=1 Tax=Eumeta variegata TaxID=151549 RepID=A0A4C1VPG5_EUMVA|nr:hypothetical protein EVAR_23090_1 [Eumeta japonica]